MRKASLLLLLILTFTLRGQISSYPYAEGWETSITWTQSTTDNFNWTLKTGSTGSSNTGPTAANEGSYYVYCETSGPTAGQTAVLEEDFNLSGLTNPLLSFDYHMYFNGASNGGTLQVDISDDGGTTWCNLWSKTGDQGNMWHDNEPVPLDGYGLGTVKIRFQFTVGTNINYQNDAAIDDITLVDAGSPTACQKPICFSSSNVQPFSFDLSWSGVTSASSGYAVIYGSSGFDPKTTGTTQTSGTTSASISGLSAGTAYDAYVYSNCGGSSDTVGPISVTTALTCQTPTTLSAANIAATSADLSWTAGGTETTWDIEYGATGFTQGAGTTVSGLTTNPYSLTGLSSSTDYDFYVRADCGANGTSPWAGPYSFTTAFQCPVGAICATYTSGDIDTEYGYSSVSATPTCPGTLSLTIPAGDWIDSVDVYYDMTAQGGGYRSEQRSRVYCTNTGQGEASLYSGTGTGGTHSYNRNSLSFANTAVGTVTFEIHAGRTWGGSGCNTTYSKVDDGTWMVVAYHSAAPSCTPPNTLTASNVAATSADLGWTSTGTETQWDIEYGAAGFTQGAGTTLSGVTANPYSLSGLTANTSYDYYVRADCGGSTSLWAGPYNFSTPCASESSFPYTQNFDASTSTPTCWVQDPANGEDWTFGSSGMTYGASSDHTGGGNFARIDDSSPHNANPANLESVPFDLTGLTTPRLVFWYQNRRTNTSGGTSQLHIDVYDGSTWNSSVLSVTTNVNTWTEYTLDLTAYKSTATKIRFRAIEDPSGFYSDPSLDDITIEETPSCLAPSSLNTANITVSGADLGWTAGGTETLWDIEYGASGFTQGAGTTISGVTNPYSISGLSSNTAYDFYVRADCGGSGTSAWSGPYTFSTSCAAFVAPYTESFDASGIPSCWSQSATSGGPWTFGTPGFSWNQSGCSGVPADNTGNAGNYAAMDHSSTDVGVVLEMFDVDISSLSTPYLEFYFYMCGTGYTPLNYLYVESYDGASWNIVATIQQGTSGWESFGYDLSSHTYSGNLVRIRFRTESGGSSSDFYGDVAIDDVTIKEAPSCLSPSNLSAANITASDAELSWTAGGTETLWDIEYGAQGFTQGAGTTVSGVSNPYTVSGLTSSTAYDFYVRADCGANGTSTWAGPYTFTTAFQCPTGAICGTYTSGNIDTDYSFQSIPGSSTCAGSMVLTIPAGDWIDSVDVYYDMTAQGGGWMSEQRSWMYSPTTAQGEASINTGSGNTGGTMSYNRNSLTFANTATGSVTFELHAGRTYGGSGCNTTYNQVDDGTWLVVAYHSAAPACTPPNTLSASSITSSGADLGWTSTGTETQWDIEYGTSGFTQGAGTTVSGVTANPYSVSGLSANTTYDFYVRADCGGANGTSSWAGPYSFTTLCAVYSTPFAESFDNTSIPSCWNSYGSDPWLFTTTWPAYGAGSIAEHTGNGGSFAGVDGSGTTSSDGTLESPEIDLSSLTIPQLAFYVFSNNTNFPGDNATLNVEVWDGSVWTLESSYSGDNSDWVFVTADLSSYTGVIKVRFIVDQTGMTNSTFYNDIMIDDVQVRETPNCPAPSALSASNITSTGADLSWTANGSETAWDIELGLKGFTPTGTPTASGVTNPYSASGLSSITAYEFYVRADCGGTNGTSTWAGPYEFQTAIPGPRTTVCGSGVASTVLTQEFDAQGSWTGDFGTGNGSWRINSGGTSSGSTGPSAAHSGSNYLYFETSTGGLTTGSIVSSEIDLSGSVGFAELSFWLHAYGATTGSLEIGVASSNTGPFTNLMTLNGQQQTASTDPWINVGINLDAYVGQKIYLEFKYTRGSSFTGDLGIDLVEVNTCVSCPAPTAFTTDTVEITEATFSWTENGSATTWLLEYGASGFTPGSGTLVSAGSNPYTITGLTENTTYDVYLRSYCAVGDSSTRVGPLSVTTLCALINTFPYTQNFDGLSPNNGSVSCTTPDGLGDCWSNEGSSDDKDWVARSFGTGSSSTGPSGDNTGGGNYLFMEASACYSQVADLYSPVFDFTTNTAPRIRFYYHMYGQSMGSLELAYSTDSGATWSPAIFSLSGDQGNNWNQDGALILSLAGEDAVIFRFRGTTGTNFYSDIAIDDITVDQAPQDEVGVTDIAISGDGCGTNQVVTATIVNFGAATQTSIPVSYNVNGSTISATWTGSLAPGASTTYAFTPTIDASMAGTYDIAAYTILAGDADNNNDTSYYTINTPTRYSTNYIADFETNPMDWTTDGIVGSGHNTSSGAVYRNLYSGVQSFTTTSARIEGISAGDVLRFNYRYTNWSAGTVGKALGTGDTLKVLISTDCGANWSLLDTVHAGNHTTSADSTLKEYDMSSYAGQVVVVRFEAKWGSGDYWLDIDNFYLGEGLSTTTSVASNFNGRDISCKNANDGEARVVAAGGVMPYSYQWDANTGSQTDDTASTLSAGKYYVTVTDAFGYELMDSITLAEPDTISVSVNATNPTCAANFDGALDLTITGGTTPYNITWSDGPATTEDRAGIDTGSYTITITDANGCSYTDTYTLIIEDVVLPTVVSQNITVYLDGGGNASIIGADVDNGSSDNCGVASLSVSPSTFTCADEGPNTVTLTVTDINGNQNTGTATVTVMDTVPPTAVCQSLTVYLGLNGMASITANDIDAGSSDNCTLSNLSISKSTFDCGDKGANTVTLTSTDQSGNQATCTATVTVLDTIPPTAVCQALTVYLDGAGNASITAGDVNDGSSDNCGISSMSLSKTSFDCSDVGSNTVTLTVIDSSFNSSTCSATVTVLDTSNPVSVVQNITVYLDASGNSIIVPSDVDAGSNDNCGISSQTVSPNSFTCADEGANTVILTNTDASGNVSTASATVTVMDTVPPFTVCQNFTVYLGLNGQATITPADIDGGTSDNCTVTNLDVSKASFDCSDKGANIVTLTATDQAGNQSTCSATVTVLDTIPPTAVCQAITVYLDGTGNANILPADIDAGSADNCGIQSLALNDSNFTCSDLGSNTVILTVTDSSFNSSTCTATVTVLDTTAPVSSAQNLTVYLDGNGQASITANDADFGTSDNCTVSNLSVSQTNFDCDHLGPNAVNLTATDQSGNQNTIGFTVTVIDTISPTITTKSHTAYLDASGNASIQVFDVSSGTSNACSIDTVYLDVYDFTCSDVGANSVTVTAQATGGSASNSAIATVTVVDTVSPVVNTQSLIMYLDANGQTSITPAMINNASTDACGIATYALDITSFDCSDLGNNTVVLTVTDVNGNSATNTAVVEVRDTITPVAKSRDRTVYLDANGSVTVAASSINNGSTDNCGFTPSLSQSVFTCADEGLNQEYLIITDADGNVDSTDFLITVLDTISPTVITRNITVQLGATGLASISPNQLDSASSDNCSNQLFYTASKTSFNCGDLGTNTVTLTATDVHGNTTSRTATVTVEDNIAPLVQTQAVILSLDASGMASLTASMVNNGSSDNCAIDSLWISKESFDCTNLGTNSVSLFARDASGNQNSSAVIVTVQDQLDPVAVGQNVTVYLNASGSASLSASAVDGGSTDNCGISGMTIDKSSFSCSDVGANTVSLTVEDASGNKTSTSVTVTVMDTVSPTVVAKNYTVALDASGAASIVASDVNDGSSDACGIASMSVSPSTFGCTDLGSNTVTLTVTDNNGNVGTTTATVTVEDNRAPVAVAQNATIYLDASGNALLSPSMIDNGSTDNCGISNYSLSKTAYTCADLGNNTVVLTLTDASGNSSNATAVVTVVDNIAPSVSTQNITVYLNSNGAASISAGMVDNGSTDNCTVSTLSLDVSSFGCTNIGANTVTLTAMDGSGNSANATATVTVMDTISPSVSTQNVTVSLDANGQGSITTSDIDDGSTDACGIASLSLDKTSFTCADLGSNTVSLTATDNNGNSNTGTATVTVVDNVNPSAVAQNITVYLSASGVATISATDVDNNSSDNCSIASMSLSNTTYDCSDVGNNTVVLTVTDGSGNSSTATSVVTVVDTVSPMVSTQNINAYLDANGVVAVSPSTVNSGSMDNCSIASYALSKSSFTCADVGPNVVTLTATDANGNTSSATATITVMDTISPNAVAQNITVNLDANGNASIVASNISAGSSDACGIASMSVSPSTFSCTDLGANTVTLTVTDVNGNSNTATSTVTVSDAIAPTVITQAHTVYLDASGQATISTSDINNGSVDNCSISGYSLSISSFDCSNTGQNLVTLTVTDGSGNSASGGAIVTVIDTISPTVSNTPANITAYSNAGQCGTTVTWPAITGSDNCSVSNITASIPSGSFFNKGVTTVSLTATDPSGNTGTSSFTITVLDTIAPVFTSGLSGITVTPNAGSCDAIVTWTAPTATDNCSGVTYTASQASGSTFPVGTTPVTITATDADGNNRSISFNVTVTDVVAPTIANVPANITVANDAGNCDAVVNYTMATVSDNCSGATITSSHPAGSVFPVGTTTVTFTALDGAGNSSTASFDITVEDQEAPVFTTVPPSDTVGQCGQVYSFTMPSGTDNCSGLLLVRQIAGLPSGSVFPPGATTNTFEISDPAGNTSTTSFTIVVVPQGQPQLPSLIEACVNDPAVNITLGQSIVWSGNGIVANGTVFDPAVAGTGRHLLSYVFTDSMGCNAIGSIAITVLPKPVTPIITKVGSTTLQTGIYNTYQWYRDGVAITGANLQNYTYTQSGNYQVEVSNTVGCFTYSAGFVVGTSGGGIGLVDLDLQQLEVYPNPNSGKFNIELNVQAIEDIQVSLYSLDGRKVYEQHLQTDHDGKVQVDVGHLPTANYFLYIRTADQVAVRKMLMK